MTEMPARMMRSRSSTRCEMKVSSGASPWLCWGSLTPALGWSISQGTSEEACRTTQAHRRMPCNACRARLDPRAPQGGALVPVRHGGLFDAPVLALRGRGDAAAPRTVTRRREIFRRSTARNARRHRRTGIPGIVQLGFVLAQIVVNRVLDVARCRLELRLHATQFVELDFTRDFGLHIVDVALCAPEQRPCRARDARQALRPENDQRDDADQRHLG